MRLNKYIASSTDLSRRAADAAIADGRVTVDGIVAQTGMDATGESIVKVDGHLVSPRDKTTTILLHKPVGYVCSRNGQGSKTIYELLPSACWHLKPVGRLDKDSSGLLVMTDDGQLANQLTHPSHKKAKVYEVTLDHDLQPLHHQLISDHGVILEDGRSQFAILRDADRLTVTMHEGRNRQIRRTFESLGYRVRTLHRTQFGSYQLADLKPGEYRAA